MRIFLACLFLVLFVALSAQLASADEDYGFGDVSDGQVNEAIEKSTPIRFLPSHPLYFLILVKENFTRFFQPAAADRAEFDFVLSEKRLHEAYQLVTVGDVKNSSKALKKYSGRVNTTVSQFEKARSQNQDVTAVTDRIIQDLQWEEILLVAIEKKSGFRANEHDFETNLAAAIGKFKDLVMAIENVKPGVKNRFTYIRLSDKETQEAPIVDTKSSPTVEATASFKPRIIIY
jgi:hypothetical protein